MTQPKVSIIIPVYKVEKYIEKCVRSLFGQTLDNLEYIFVDDCSPDKSIAIMQRILEEFPERKTQVKIIHHTINKGVSQSRQDGLDAATGEYIIHCDSDDWVEINMYKLLYNTAKENKADIVGCDYIKEFQTKHEIHKQDFTKLREEAVIAMLSGKLHSALWSRLIRRQFILDQKQYFTPNINLREDLLYVVPLHLATDNVISVSEPLYHYREVQNSLTKIKTKSQVESALRSLKGIESYCLLNLKLKDAYQEAYALASLPYITLPCIYDPKKWILYTNNIPLKYFKSFKHRISPWLVRHKFITMNLYLIKMYNCGVRRQ